MKSVCIIPARGGSKRIPKKNIKLFAGKPIIAHAIEMAAKSGLFDAIYVSTDDVEIAKVSMEYGALIIDRPASLSDDFTGTHEVIQHAVQSLIGRGNDFDSVCCLYATAPFVINEDLISGFEKLKEGNWFGVVAATYFSFPVQRGFIRTKNGGLKMLFPEHYKTRSQDLPQVYHEAGQFYWMSKENCLKDPEGFGENTEMIILPSWRVQDIDTIEDWVRAELIWKILKKNKGKR